MPLVTVVGATNPAFPVTLTGNNAKRQLGMYKAAMSSNRNVNSTVGGGVADNTVGGGSSPYQTAAHFEAVSPMVRSGATTLAIMQPGSTLSATSYTTSSSMVGNDARVARSGAAIPAVKGQADSISGVSGTGNILARPSMYATVSAAALLPTVSGATVAGSASRPSLNGAGVLDARSSVSAGHALTEVKTATKPESVGGGHNAATISDSTSGITLSGAHADSRHPSISGSGVSVAGSNARDLDQAKAAQATVSALSGARQDGHNFTLDTSTGAVSSGWKDTISAAGHTLTAGHTTADASKISVSGPLSFIGGTIHPVGGAVVGDGLATSTVTAGNATIFSGNHDMTSRYMNDLNHSNARDHALSSFTFDTASAHKTLGVPAAEGGDTLKGANAASSDSLSHYLRADSLRGGTAHSALNAAAKNDLLNFVKGGDVQHHIADFSRIAGKKMEKQKAHRAHFEQFSSHGHEKGAVRLNDGTQIQFNDAAAANNLLGDDIFKS